MSHGELLTMCTTLLVAGHETTTNLIAVGTLELLRHPDQLRALRQSPDLLSSAVEELLRFVSPVQRAMRLALEAVVVGRRTIAAAERVTAALAAANRDPAVFPDPDRLDLGRAPSRHLAFGHGIHFCLGAPLARLEAEIVFAALLVRLLRFELATTALDWSPNTAIRGLTRLPVRCW